MRKVSLFVNGNILANTLNFRGGKSDIVCLANPSDFDLSEAIVVDGDFSADILTVYGIIAVTGDVTEKGGSYANE